MNFSKMTEKVIFLQIEIAIKNNRNLSLKRQCNKLNILKNAE